MEPRLDLIWRWFKFLYHSMKLFWLHVLEDLTKMTLFEQKSALSKLICTPLWNRVTYLNHKMFVPNRFDWGSQVPFEGHGYMINSKVTCHLHWQSSTNLFQFMVKCSTQTGFRLPADFFRLIYFILLISMKLVDTS